MRDVRVFVPGPLAAGSVIALPDQAAEHVVRVLRLRSGAALSVFDGSGGEHAAEITEVGRRAVSARVGAHHAIERESPLQATLVQGLARGEKMDWIVQKATELGVARIVPVTTERSVVQLEGGRADKRVAHWRAVAIAACEQCGRNRVPVIDAPVALAEAAALAGAGPRWMMAPGAARSLYDHAAGLAALPPPHQPWLLVGPEGGLTEAEAALAARGGFVPVSLGPRVLRTETAGVAALSLLQALAGDLGR
jgi:16S rRNA (uracil1498-N3)-methyltransferase